MSFSQSEYVVSHTMTNASKPHQPVILKVDLCGLISIGECSTLFVVDKMNLTAYKQGTVEKIPVKFAIVNNTDNRILTNEPGRLSSKWNVNIDCGSRMKIAGTDTEPFHRALPVYDEENRQALINVLAFMMSESLWASDKAQGAFDLLVESTRGEYEFTCQRCLQIGIACVKKEPPSELPAFSFPSCVDGYVCIPSPQALADKEYDALRNLLTLLRVASVDNLDIVTRISEEISTDAAFEELECTYGHQTHGYKRTVEIPYTVVKYISTLYQTMSEYADNFAIVDRNRHYIKVLIESPSENIGEVTGSVLLTKIYGSTLLAIYNKLIHGLHNSEVCEEQQLDSLVNITQLSPDVLIRRTQLTFVLNNHMSLKDWFCFYYGCAS